MNETFKKRMEPIENKNNKIEVNHQPIHEVQVPMASPSKVDYGTNTEADECVYQSNNNNEYNDEAAFKYDDDGFERSNDKGNYDLSEEESPCRNCVVCLNDPGKIIWNFSKHVYGDHDYFTNIQVYFCGGMAHLIGYYM